MTCAIVVSYIVEVSLKNHILLYIQIVLAIVLGLLWLRIFAHATITNPFSGASAASLWEYSGIGFWSVVLEFNRRMLNQNTNPRNGAAVAFLWELKTFPPKLCLIGFQLNSVNQFKQPRPDKDLVSQMKMCCILGFQYWNINFMEVLSPF